MSALSENLHQIALAASPGTAHPAAIASVRCLGRKGTAFALVLAAGLALSGCAQTGSNTCDLASASPSPAAVCELPAASSAPSHVPTFDEVLRHDMRYGSNGWYQAKATAENARVESERRQKLTTLAVSEEIKQTYAAQASSTHAAHQ